MGNDPAKVVRATALLAGVVSLDGAGSTTFIITTSAMLPLYLRLGMSPVVLTVVAGLIKGTMNILPWGGPTVRAAASLGLDPAEVFVPMIPSLVAGVIIVFAFAWFLGIAERNRLGGTIDSSRFNGNADNADDDSSTGGSFRGTNNDTPRGDGNGGGGVLVDVRENKVDEHVSISSYEDEDSQDGLTDTMLDPHRATLRPNLIWFNLILTIVVMVALVADIFPLAFVFMVGTGPALAVNFPKVKDQATEMLAHSSSIVGVVSMVLAAGVLVGVFSGTGMVDAIAAWITSIIPDSMGAYLAPITGLLSIPMTFFMSNDAFYFGILPVLSKSAAHFGIEPVEMARASITRQPVHMQSPLVRAILLLMSLAKVNLGNHHKKGLWRAVIVALTMLVVGILVGVIPLAA